MPGLDGTGPLRLRLRGGRGLMRLARGGGRGMGRGLLGLGIPVAIAVVQDLARPDGYLRPLVGRFLKRRPPLEIVSTTVDRIEDGHTGEDKP